MIGQTPELQLIIALGPSLISGIFTIISAMLQVKLKDVPISSPVITPITGVSHFVSLGKVLLHAGIVLVVGTTAFFVVFVTTSHYGVPLAPFVAQFLLFKWAASVLAFVWVAAKVNRVIRWKHLIYVAVMVAIIIPPIYPICTFILHAVGAVGTLPADTLSNFIFYTCYTWIQVFASMGVGGAITNAMKSD